MTGSGTIVESLDEIDEWDRVAERTAAGEEKIYEYNLFRYGGKTHWSVGFLQREGDETKHLGRQPTYRPKSNMSPETILKIVEYWDPLIEAAVARNAIPCPPERHDIDGVLVYFEVWAADIPGIGRLEYGVGKPPVE